MSMYSEALVAVSRSVSVALVVPVHQVVHDPHGPWGIPGFGATQTMGRSTHFGWGTAMTATSPVRNQPSAVKRSAAASRSWE